MSSTMRARPDRNTSRLRVFREEEFQDPDAVAEEPVQPARVRQAKVTQPLPLPRSPHRQ